jgi:hypothetical protein
MHHPIPRAGVLLLALSGFLASCTRSESSTYEYTNPLTGERTLVKGQAMDGWELYDFEEDALVLLRRAGVIQVVADRRLGTRLLIQSENDQDISIYLSDADADGVFDQLHYSVGPNAHVFDYNADGQPDVMALGGATTIARITYVSADQDGGVSQTKVTESRLASDGNRRSSVTPNQQLQRTVIRRGSAEATAIVLQRMTLLCCR